METKSLRLQGSGGKVEYLYNLELDIPPKSELLSLIEGPPHFIISKNEITFSTGILAQVSHSIKLRISRDYQDPFVGVHIKLSTKPDELIEVVDIKGTFIIISPAANSNLSSQSGSESRPEAAENNLNFSQQLENNNVNIAAEMNFNAAVGRNHLDINALYRPRNNNNNNINAGILPNLAVMNFNPYLNNGELVEYSDRNNGNGQQRRASFNFQETSKRFSEMNGYNYFESHPHYWPIDQTKLRITFKITKTNYSVIVSIDEETTAPCLSPNNSSSLFNAEPFYLSENCSDVKIKVGSTIIPAHKIILAARSEYFSRMFSTEMRESFEGVVEISDVDESHMKQLIQFIYMGKVDNPADENLTELFLLADKYDIPELAIYCEKKLLSSLNVENAIEMYDLSHTVGRRGILAKKSKEIIMWNKEKFAPDLDTFKEFFSKYPDLIFELIKL